MDTRIKVDDPRLAINIVENSIRVAANRRARDCAVQVLKDLDKAGYKIVSK